MVLIIPLFIKNERTLGSKKANSQGHCKSQGALSNFH